MNLLQRIKIYRVLWRSQLFLGGERELVLMLSVISTALIINGMNLPSMVVGVLVWMLGMPALRWMAKFDPQFSQVYRRSLKYKRYYPARSRPYRKT
jgi:type IV secretion system protein TrbD